MQIFAHFVACVLKGNFFFFFWELLRIMKVKSHSLCLPPKNKPKYKCSLGSSNECHPHWGCPAMNHILLETDTDLRVTSAFVHTEYKAFIPRDTTTVDCDCMTAGGQSPGVHVCGIVKGPLGNCRTSELIGIRDLGWGWPLPVSHLILNRRAWKAGGLSQERGVSRPPSSLPTSMGCSGSRSIRTPVKYF